LLGRSLPFMLGAGAAFSVALTAFRFTSGFNGGATGELDEEEVERREALKKMRRRPLSETIEQLGEGRGRHILDVVVACADNYRYLRSGLRGEEATALDGQVRDRCQGCAGGELGGVFALGKSRSRVERLIRRAVYIYILSSVNPSDSASSISFKWETSSD
jgi:hypothetical protein